MSLVPLYDERQMTLVLSIQECVTVQDKMASLHQALLEISKKSADNSIYFWAIDLAGTWKIGDDEFDPWSESNLNAWIDLAKCKDSLDPLRAWLNHLEKILLLRRKEERAPLWESDVTLFGEVALSVLAIMYLDFVPFYARFLDAWDGENSRQRDSTIQEIVASHGRCPEIEKLIFDLIFHDGIDGDLINYSLRSDLENMYGDFTKSDLFRRIIEAIHAAGADWQDNEGNWAIFRYTPSWPELKEKAEEILAELDAK